MSATQPPPHAPASDLPVRLFFALWPDADTVRALTRWADRAQAICGGRVMRPDTLHLTLGFLGETAPELVSALARETRARRIRPGVVTLSRFGAFPRPRIVWAGPAGNGQAGNGQEHSEQADEGAARLAEEHHELWDWVRPLHPARPEAHFRPHVTLLRNADTREVPAPPPAPIPWRYDRYVLVASTQDGSARYRILASTQA